MEVPEEVLDLLADLRKHLQEECEPPVYVSDRRLVKSLALLQARPSPRSFLQPMWTAWSRSLHAAQPARPKLCWMGMDAFLGSS